MAGHSAWKNIKYRKAIVDARRGKIWGKCSRAIIAAARQGGPDPETNLALRYAIEEARSVNMPKETIEKAIKRGTGQLQADHYENLIYEGYGPGGVAILLEVLTDNRNRTAPEIKKIFERHGGNLGPSGCVAFNFQTRGQILLPRQAVSEDRIMETALQLDADDVTSQGDFWQVLCEPTRLSQLRKAFEAAGLPVHAAQITMIPLNTVQVTGETARRLLDLLEELEDHDDVQKVHANFEIPDQELAAFASSAR